MNLEFKKEKPSSIIISRRVQTERAKNEDVDSTEQEPEEGTIQLQDMLQKGKEDNTQKEVMEIIDSIYNQVRNEDSRVFENIIQDGYELLYEDGSVKGGSLLGLVYCLVRYVHEGYYITSMILPYRRYISPIDFFNMLCGLYNEANNCEKSNNHIYYTVSNYICY